MQNKLGRLLAICVVLNTHCSGGTDTDIEEPTGSACGEPEYGLSLDFEGKVLRADGSVAVNAEVALEDRSFRPAIVLGSATSGQDGTFALAATDITSLPGCWLTALDYRLVASDSEQSGELMVNRDMWNAIQDGQALVDLTDEPIQMEPL